jgi:hypothetical protein
MSILKNNLIAAFLRGIKEAAPSLKIAFANLLEGTVFEAFGHTIIHGINEKKNIIYNSSNMGANNGNDLLEQWNPLNWNSPLNIKNPVNPVSPFNPANPFNQANPINQD